MRQIKFRAWHKSLEQMLTPDMWHNYGPSLVNGVLKSDDHEIMQFSGVLDKNEVEIYEADIIQCTRLYRIRPYKSSEILSDIKPERHTLKGVVTFIGGSFYINGEIAVWLNSLPTHHNRGENYNSEWSEYYSDFEVIGNIYENPEILK